MRGICSGEVCVIPVAEGTQALSPGPRVSHGQDWSSAGVKNVEIVRGKIKIRFKMWRNRKINVYVFISQKGDPIGNTINTRNKQKTEKTEKKHRSKIP